MTAVGFEDARIAPALLMPGCSADLRRTKIAAALAVSALVGVGSYAATYRARTLVSQPSPGIGSVVLGPHALDDTGATHAPVPLTPRATPVPAGSAAHVRRYHLPLPGSALSRTIRCTSDSRRAHATSGWSWTKGRNCQRPPSA